MRLQEMIRHIRHTTLGWSLKDMDPGVAGLEKLSEKGESKIGSWSCWAGRAELEGQRYKQELGTCEPQMSGGMWPQMQQDTWTSCRDLVCIMKAQ